RRRTERAWSFRARLTSKEAPESPRIDLKVRDSGGSTFASDTVSDTRRDFQRPLAIPQVAAGPPSATRYYGSRFPAASFAPEVLVDYANFKRLISGGERTSIDFKIHCGAFASQDIAANAELAKDIIAMCNNGGKSFLIIGVSDSG